MVHVPRRGHNHPIGLVEVLQVLQHVLTPHFPQALPRAQYGPTQGVLAPELLGEEIVDQVVGVVLDHLDLFQDDSALLFDVRGIQLGVQQ